MSFPTSPVDGQLYTYVLGTQYKFYLADTAWKIVNGGGGGTIGGSGTANKIAKFTDATTIGVSSLTDTGNVHGTGNLTMDGTVSSASGESVFHQLKVQGSTTSIATCYQPDTSSYSFIRCLAEASNTEIDLISFGTTMAGTGGPDGTKQAGGVCIEGQGKFMEINMQSGNQMNLSYMHSSKIIIDTTGAMINNIRPISGANVNFQNCGQIITQTGVSDSTSSIVRVVDQRASGDSWMALDLRDDLLDHDCTNYMPSTKSYGAVGQIGTGTNYGGLRILGAATSSNTSGITLDAISENPGSIQPVMRLNCSKMDGGDSSNLLDTEYALQITNNNTAKIYVMGRGAMGLGMIPYEKTMFSVSGLPVYADNTAATADGLGAGDFYRNGANPDLVCVVH